jgi:hypothetical protein
VKPKILFILKMRQAGAYGTWSYEANGKMLPSGLSNSAQLMSEAFESLGFESKVVQVIDNNFIDREVHQYRPTHVFIEAFWVVPSKFEILKKLHPTVTWIVRNHSKMDFLAHEGTMMGWAIDYLRDGIAIASNSPEAYRDMGVLAKAYDADPKGSLYLPNFYKINKPEHLKPLDLLRRLKLAINGKVSDSAVLNIGCFGAVRPLKNHLHQALAAIEVADKLGKSLMFYIISTRVEGKADSILRCLRAIFERTQKHQLVEVPWKDHDEFVEFSKSMDVVMQVSMSETFNIVAADAVAAGVPVLVSAEVPWTSGISVADPHNVADIAKKLLRIIRLADTGLVQHVQQHDLQFYSETSREIWRRYVLGLDQILYYDCREPSLLNRLLMLL